MSSLSTSSNTSMRFVSMTTEEAFRLLNLAASLLQANIKMFLQRKKYLTFMRRHRAARKIQALWRGYYYTRNLDKNVQKLRHEFFIKIMQQNLELHYERNKNNNEEFKQQQMIIINILEELIKTNLVSVNHTPSECDNKTDNDVTSIESLIKETCNQVDELTVQDESLPYDSLLVYDENDTQIDIIQLNNEDHLEKQTLKTKVAWENQLVSEESKSHQRDESDDKEVHISTLTTDQPSENDKDNDFYDENTLNQVDSNMLPCDSESNMLLCDSESVMLPCDSESVMLPCNSKSVRLPCNSERVTLPCDSGINIESPLIKDNSNDMTKLPAVTVSSEKDSSKVHLSNDEQIKVDGHPSDSSLSIVTKVLVELMHDTLKNIHSKELHSHESL